MQITEAVEVLKERRLVYKPEGIGGSCLCDGCSANRPVYKALSLAIQICERLTEENLVEIMTRAEGKSVKTGEDVTRKELAKAILTEFMEKRMDYVICVDKATKLITPESVMTKCVLCNRKVWCSPWNMNKKPLCVHCVEVLIEKEQQGGEEVKIAISRRDFQRAAEFIKETHANEEG